MMRVLKIALIVFGVIHILLGLAFILAPNQTATMMGFGEIGEPAVYIAAICVYIAAICGVTFIAASVWLIVIARDPLKHITWVKFAILWPLLGIVVQLYLVVQGVVDFGQARLGIIDDAVFAVVFLAFYPYRAIRSG
jgi:hypothetical protein